MRYISLSSGQRLAIYQREAAPEPSAVPMLLVHGFCEDSTIWSPVLAALEHIRIIIVDLPGFGASDLPLDAHMGAYAEALRELMDAMGIEQCVLVGHSLGGYVGLEFAARYGERLGGLCLFHSHPFEDTPERKEIRRRGIEMIQSGKKDLYVTQLFPNLFAPGFIDGSTEVLRLVTEQGKKQSAEAIITALKAMIGRRDHRDTLKNIGCPVLFILGENDNLVPLESALQAALLPDIAEVLILEGVGHMGMFEDTAASVQALTGFYQTTSLY